MGKVESESGPDQPPSPPERRREGNGQGAPSLPPFTFQRRQRGTLPPKQFPLTGRLGPGWGGGEKGGEEVAAAKPTTAPPRTLSIQQPALWPHPPVPSVRTSDAAIGSNPFSRTRAADQSLSPLPPPQDFSPMAKEGVREERGKHIDARTHTTNSLPREQVGV